MSTAVMETAPKPLHRPSAAPAFNAQVRAEINAAFAEPVNMDARMFAMQRIIDIVFAGISFSSLQLKNEFGADAKSEVFTRLSPMLSKVNPDQNPTTYLRTSVNRAFWKFVAEKQCPEHTADDFQVYEKGSIGNSHFEPNILTNRMCDIPHPLQNARDSRKENEQSTTTKDFIHRHAATHIDKIIESMHALKDDELFGPRGIWLCGMLDALQMFRKKIVGHYRPCKTPLVSYLRSARVPTEDTPLAQAEENPLPERYDEDPHQNAGAIDGE